MIGRLAVGRSKPAAARRLDPQPVARVQLSLAFAGSSAAVEQVAPGRAVAAAVAAPRGVAAALGDQA